MHIDCFNYFSYVIYHDFNRPFRFDQILHAILYYFTYSILNWGRAANSTIQPLIKLKSKAIKLVKPSNHTTLEEILQH